MRSRRAASEIETLFCLVVLITFLLLAVGLWHLGVARLSTAQTAEFEAFQDGTQSQSPQYAGNAAYPPLDGISTIRPGLPNRLSVPESKQSVAMSNLNTVSVNGFAAVASPAWSYRGYPDSGDQDATAAWFQNYVDESHADLIQPLGLSQPWTP
jgi:hypothetical protein